MEELGFEDIEYSEEGWGCWRYALIGLGVFVFLYIFRNEIRLFWSFISPPFLIALNRTPPEAPSIDQLRAVFLYLFGGILVWIGMAMILAIMLTQVMFPPFRGTHRKELLRRFSFVFSGVEAPILIVKDGGIVGKQPDSEKTKGGIAFVDLSSAVVLEGSVSRKKPGESGKKKGKMLELDAHGPGMIFFSEKQKLAGSVSLRNQYRQQKDVRAYTSDGIEVVANVNARFTLGQAPSVIKIAYYEDQICVLKIDEKSKLIESISDELDEVDKAEAESYAQWFIASNIPSQRLLPDDDNIIFPPFVVDKNRIKAVMYPRARKVGEEEVDDWTSLPLLEAIKIFRNEISKWKLDQLYFPDSVQLMFPSGSGDAPPELHEFPLHDRLKPQVGRMLRYSGVVSYQFLERKNGQALAVGQKVDARQFRISPVQPMRASKILRDRGIKVLGGGFSDPKPVDETVAKQRLEHWQARWQQSVNTVLASQDEQVIQILNQARVEKQREIITELSQILSDETYSDEALMLRLFQALENFSTDPNVQRLLPGETINMLKNLRSWVSLGGNDTK